MNSSPEEIIAVVPGESFGEPLEFQALPLCCSSKDPLPVLFKEAKSGTLYSAEVFAKEFSLVKWHPVLVAQGISLEDFENLVDATPEYGRSFKYEFDVDKRVYFIVDNASIIHENYTAAVIGCIYAQLAQEYMHSSSGFLFGQPQLSHDLYKRGYKIPDGAIWINGRYENDPKIQKLPFIVVETAISQATRSFMDKLEIWRQAQIPYLIGIDRKEINQTVEVHFYSRDMPDRLFRLKFGRFETISFELKKSILAEGYNVSTIDKNPSNDELIGVAEFDFENAQ